MRIASKSEKSIVILANCRVPKNAGELPLLPAQLQASLGVMHTQTTTRIRCLQLLLTYFPAKVMDLSESSGNLISRYQSRKPKAQECARAHTLLNLGL